MPGARNALRLRRRLGSPLAINRECVPVGNEDPVSEAGAPKLRALGETRFTQALKQKGRWVRTHRPFCVVWLCLRRRLSLQSA
jgi:hypothetical protein